MKMYGVRNYKSIIGYVFIIILLSILCYGIIQLMTNADPTEDWRAVNLEMEAAITNDGDEFYAEIVVSHDPSPETSLNASSDEPQTPMLINLNTAEAYELEKLPGIGPVKAKAIVDYRVQNGKFESIEDVIKVNGIGQITLENIRELVRVDN